MDTSVSGTTGSRPVESGNHPCFNRQARHTHARVHLPVAPRCNMQCNYCDRKFNCVNESRPGVTCAILDPRQALEYLHRTAEKFKNLSVVGIAGPGDPFACPQETLETLRLVRAEFPHLLLCVATNGLALPAYVNDLAEIGVSHVTVTVNAVDPLLGARFYRWMSVDGHRIEGIEAAALLWENQSKSIAALAARGTTVKVNSIYVPGISGSHILDVARTVAGLGANIHNIMALFPTPNTPFANFPEPEKRVIAQARSRASQYLSQMSHCSRCRADAAGMVGEEHSQAQIQLLQICSRAAESRVTSGVSGSIDSASGLPMTLSPQLQLFPTGERPYVAIASRDGVFVDQHLGEARQLRIYKPEAAGQAALIELRSVVSEAGGAARWMNMLDGLKDCCGILVSGAGAVPRAIFARYGITVGLVEGAIEDALQATAAGKNLKFMARPGRFACDSSCGDKTEGCA